MWNRLLYLLLTIRSAVSNPEAFKKPTCTDWYLHNVLKGLFLMFKCGPFLWIILLFFSFSLVYFLFFFLVIFAKHLVSPVHPIKFIFTVHTHHMNTKTNARSICPKMSGVSALRGATCLQRSIELPKHHIYFEKRQASRFSFCFLFLLNLSTVRKWNHKRLLRKANTDVEFNHHNLST